MMMVRWQHINILSVGIFDGIRCFPEEWRQIAGLGLDRVPLSIRPHLIDNRYDLNEVTSG